MVNAAVIHLTAPSAAPQYIAIGVCQGENKVWKTGQRLFLEAKKHGQRMPVIFASADVTDKLLYYAVLSNLVIDEASSTTSYQFNHLQPVKGDFPLSSLRLRSTNRPLSDNYIRPYAICHTPSFIR